MMTREVMAHWLRVLGGVAMGLGTLDPLEGSVLILPGSGLVALGVYLGGKPRSAVRYWAWAFLLIAAGVAAMFALSAAGGIGGRTGRSMWWGLLILPYPVGWLLALSGGIVAGVRQFRDGRQTARA